MMQRFPDWPERLVAYIAERENRAFEWGKAKHDCCSFANGGVIATTGEDMMADIPEYSGADEADAILATPLDVLLDARLPRGEIGMAHRGDIALAVLNGLDTLMIVEGDMLVGPGKRRLQRLPRHLMSAVWKI